MKGSFYCIQGPCIKIKSEVMFNVCFNQKLHFAWENTIKVKNVSVTFLIVHVTKLIFVCLWMCAHLSFWKIWSVNVATLSSNACFFYYYYFLRLSISDPPGLFLSSFLQFPLTKSSSNAYDWGWMSGLYQLYRFGTGITFRRYYPSSIATESLQCHTCFCSG